MAICRKNARVTAALASVDSNDISLDENLWQQACNFTITGIGSGIFSVKTTAGTSPPSPPRGSVCLLPPYRSRSSGSDEFSCKNFLTPNRG